MEMTKTITKGEAHHAFARGSSRRSVSSCRRRWSSSVVSRCWQAAALERRRVGFPAASLQVDELVGAWRELADTVAERAVALGCWPDGQAGAVAETGTLEPVSPGALADREVVELLTSCLAEAVGRARSRMDSLGPLDLASQDLLIEVVRALEQQLWMVRAQREL